MDVLFAVRMPGVHMQRLASRLAPAFVPTSLRSSRKTVAQTLFHQTTGRGRPGKAAPPGTGWVPDNWALCLFLQSPDRNHFVVTIQCFTRILLKKRCAKRRRDARGAATSPIHLTLAAACHPPTSSVLAAMGLTALTGSLSPTSLALEHRNTLGVVA